MTVEKFDVDNRAKTAGSHFRYRALAAIHTKQYLEIAEFPHPVQKKLLGIELSSVTDRIATGKQVPTHLRQRLDGVYVSVQTTEFITMPPYLPPEYRANGLDHREIERMP
jgi:hypothetical protein